MKRKLLPLSVIIVSLFLSACKEDAKSMTWYKDHPSELVDVYKKCKTTGEDSDNCRNAYDASMRISGSLPEAKEIVAFDKGFKQKDN